MDGRQYVGCSLLGRGRNSVQLLVILFINMYTAHSQKYRERGLSRAERKQAKELAGQGDSLDPVGGDALRIDREALAELMRDGAVAKVGR